MISEKFSNIVQVSQKRAAEHPDREFIIFLKDGEIPAVVNGNSGSINYQQNDHAARLVAGALQKRDIIKGDRVLIILPNSLEFVNIFYGCLYAGILAVPL